ncbi:hypothetical protein B0H66DRAFT_539768 [Apodospora peruviana]|uniref:Apple domain-containing protein n=1 Tax=Apodospora peruviana TaxID=516989 RepID=A0AAE0IQ83_9PEZI|nr:hypothetical protein B0H66DRAFT_539768 [Apodospora peruviana]
MMDRDIPKRQASAAGLEPMMHHSDLEVASSSSNRHVHPQQQTTYSETPTYYQSTEKDWQQQQHQQQQQQPKRRILGLTVPVFWTILIILVLIVAGAIGGGIGAGMAASKSKSSTSSSSDFSSNNTTSNSPPATTTTSAPSITTVVGTGPTVSPAPVDGGAGCPSIDGTKFIPLNAQGQQIAIDSSIPSQSFAVECNTNYPSGEAYGNPFLYDIMILYLPSLDDCIAACASYNAMYTRPQVLFDANAGKGFCRSVTIVKSPGEYCYLKNGTATNNTFGNPGGFTSARLIEDPTAATPDKIKV